MPARAQAVGKVEPIWSKDNVPEWAAFLEIGITLTGKLLVRYTAPYMVLLSGDLKATAKIKVRLPTAQLLAPLLMPPCRAGWQAPAVATGLCWQGLLGVRRVS